MSNRNEVLNNFCSISNSFSENISVYYSLNCNDTLGISYFELNRVSNELARYFSQILGENSQYVGVSISDYFFLPCIILGVWKSKNCFAGVGTQYTKANTVDFLNFLPVKYLITDNDKNEFGGELFSRFIVHQRHFFVWCRQIQKEISGSEDICYGIMTSGTTGEPKIIQVPWSCILPNAVELSDEFQVTEHDCIFLASPYSFDPFFIELLMAFLKGSTLMIASDAVKLSSSELLKTLFDSTEIGCSDSSPVGCDHTENENHFQMKVQKVSKKNVTILQMTPSVFRRWTDNEIKNFILSLETPLRVLVLGGERFPKEILKLRHPHNKTRIFNIYGITEISCWAFLNEVSLTGNCFLDSDIAIGRPLHNVVYKISKEGEFVLGSSERICLVNKEEACQLKKPVYRGTGDVVNLSDGEIYYLGRINQVVKKYGMKINLSKIEEAFMKENNSIKQCFCIYDDKNFKLGLFYIPVMSKPNQINYRLITSEEFYKNNYKIPIQMLKSIEKPDYLIEISETPLNSHGKCDKQQLMQVLKGIYKTEQKPDLKVTFKKLWLEVLGIRDVSLTADFIQLGGNSVLCLDFINKLENEGFDVPPNFVAELLGGKSYESCLECLIVSQEKFGTPAKKIKFASDIGKIDLSQVWKFDMGKCVDAPVTVFVYEGEERLVVGSHSSKLSCIKPDSGCEIWSIFLGDRIESGFRPTKDGSKGFIGCYDHYVYCIATSNGSVIWKFKTDDMIKSTPCLSTDEDIVYVASYDTFLYCLSVTEGKPKKSLKLGNGGVRCPGVASDSLNTFFIGTLDGSCLAINQETNEPTWKTILGTPIFAAPCLIPKKPEILFSEVLGNVHCLNALNGNKLWTFKAGGNIYSSPIVEVLDIIYAYHIIFGCHDTHLYCLRYQTEPELKWKQQLDSSVFATPLNVLDFSSVCATTTKGVVYLCDFAAGSVKALLQLEGEVFSSAVYSKSRLFVGCRDNNVYSLEISKKTYD